MSEKRARALAVLACLGVALALAAPAAFGDRDIYVGDVSYFELPRDELVSQRLRAGEGLPRWIPGIYGGAPALGGQELALFYPPNDLLLLLAPERARIWGLVFHLFLAALGARALAKRLGAGESAALVAGLVYGFGGAAVSMNIVLVYTRTAAWLPWAVLGLVRGGAGERRGLAIATLAFVGTYLGGDPLGCAFAALAGVATTLAVPSPEPLALRARRTLATLALAAGLTALIGAAQLVPASLAVSETARQEGISYEGATRRSLWPPELVGLVVPFVFGSSGAPRTAWYKAITHEERPAWAEVVYVGPLALALAGLALFWTLRKQARKGQKSTEYAGAVRAGLLLVAIFLPLALGKHFFAYRLFYLLPGASLFRFPAKLFLHASLGIALLAGAGVQSVLSDEPGKEEPGGRRKLALGTLAVLGGLLLLASLVATAGREAFGGRIDALGAPELDGKAVVDALAGRIAHAAYFAFGGALLLAKKRSSRKRLGVALAALVALDLALAWRPSFPNVTDHDALILGPRESIVRPPVAAALLAELAKADGSPARVYSTFAGRSETDRDLEEARAAGDAGILRGPFEGLLPDAGLAQGVLSQLGFLSNAPLRPSVVGVQADELRRAGLISPARDAALRGARFVICRDDETSRFAGTGEAAVVASLPGGRTLVRLTRAPPWAAVYRRARFASGIQGGLDVLQASQRAAASAVIQDSWREVVLEGASPEPALEGPGDALVHEARVSLLNGKLEPERVVLDVETPARGWLVVRETFARGWTATVGGKPAAILPADVAFRAVLVPEGRSRVVLEYAAPGATLGALVSLLGVVACFVLWVRGRPSKLQTSMASLIPHTE